MIPYDKKFQHVYAGQDDMSSHGLCNLIGVSLNVGIKNGKLLIGKH